MSETKFTPGPWEDNGWFIHADSADICEMFEIDADDSTEADANARLIAAAPDMYEALKKIQEAIDVVGWDYIDSRKLCKMVDAAIAKAEGRS